MLPSPAPAWRNPYDLIRTFPELGDKPDAIDYMLLDGPFRRAVLRGFNELGILRTIGDRAFARRLLVIVQKWGRDRIQKFDGEAPNKAVCQAVSALKDYERIVRADVCDKRSDCRYSQLQKEKP